MSWDTEAPEYPFRLGLIHRDQPTRQDLALARIYLERAVELNPHNWRYRLELARLYEFSGLLGEAEEAYLKAIGLNPRSALYRWRLANFYIRTGKLEDSFLEFQVALELDFAGYSRPCATLLWKAGTRERDIDAIWPEDRSARLQLLHFMVEKQANHDYLGQEWTRLLEGPSPLSLQEGSFYIDYLLKEERHQEARAQWASLAGVNGLKDRVFRQKHNLIWNGDFELPISGNTLDWKLSSSSAFAMKHQDQYLEIDFLGNDNLNFRGLEQRFIVDPGQGYSFAFKALSEEISTEQGIYFHVQDATTGATLLQTDPIRGTTPWTEYLDRINVPANSHLLSISLKRRRSKRIDNRLRGRFVLDWVVLKSPEAQS